MNSRSTFHRALLPALLLTGLSFGAALPALAQNDAAPLPHQKHGPGEHGTRDDFGGHRHHGGGPFMHELKQLDLSDSQRETIKGYMQAFREQERGGWQAMQSAHRAFETAAPGSAGYSTVVTQMADAAANAARDRVQKSAALRAQIYGVLTDAQKSKLASDLASLPERPAHR